jgi:hypothetical protein
MGQLGWFSLLAFGSAAAVAAAGGRARCRRAGSARFVAENGHGTGVLAAAGRFFVNRGVCRLSAARSARSRLPKLRRTVL